MAIKARSSFGKNNGFGLVSLYFDSPKLMIFNNFSAAMFNLLANVIIRKDLVHSAVTSGFKARFTLSVLGLFERK